MIFNRIPYRASFAFVVSLGATYSAYAAETERNQGFVHPREVVQKQNTQKTALPVATQTKHPSALEEVVVRSNRRAQQAVNTPASVVALTGKTLQTTGVRDALSLARDIPGLMAESTSGSTNPRYRLRGIGTNDFSANMTTAVGVSEDEVFLDSGASQGTPIYDLDHVEVFRGPQGTLQGKNTTAGMVSYYTKKPTNTLDGYVRGTAGNYGLWGRKGLLVALL